MKFFPVNIYLFKVKYRITRKKCEVCPKLKIKTPEQRQHTSHLFLVFLLLNLRVNVRFVHNISDSLKKGVKN